MFGNNGADGGYHDGLLHLLSVQWFFHRLYQGEVHCYRELPEPLGGFVWGPMESMFNTALQDIYTQQTRLQMVKRGGDLTLSGEITNYDAYNKGVGADGYSTMAELRMTVRVTFTNNSNPQENFEAKQFSSSREYDATQQLASVQDELVNQMIKDIVDQIFNATVANW